MPMPHLPFLLDFSNCKRKWHAIAKFTIKTLRSEDLATAHFGEKKLCCQAQGLPAKYKNIY